MAKTSSGRYSRYPAVNRDVKVSGDTLEGLSPEDIGKLSVRDVISWVGEDEGRRRFALRAELKGRHRTTLVATLRGS